MIIEIVQAEYVDGYRIWLRFNTGESGLADLQEVIFRHAAAEPLRNIEAFKQFYLDSWPTVAWECGFDLSPESLYERAVGKAHGWDYPPSLMKPA